jgi:isopentenyl phosphate kinase
MRGEVIMLTLLKLGGSLITDKHSPQTPKPEVIDHPSSPGDQRRLSTGFLVYNMKLILGHGSGSFGHVSGQQIRHALRVYTTAEGWLGFAEVWSDARALNQIVVEALIAAVGLPIIAHAALSRGYRSAGGKSRGMESRTDPEPRLSAGLIPLVNGDTIFDRIRGGTILSTEDLFYHLAYAPEQHSRILLAGIEDGVWLDFPDMHPVDRRKLRQHNDERVIAASERVSRGRCYRRDGG